MTGYLGSEKDQWVHWLTKIMLCKQLALFIELIPCEKPSELKAPGTLRQTSLLPTSIYTKMFKYFIRQRDFASLQRMVERTPEHVTNADTIINELKPMLDDS